MKRKWTEGEGKVEVEEGRQRGGHTLRKWA